jgi:hypothetical protein
LATTRLRLVSLSKLDRRSFILKQPRQPDVNRILEHQVEALKHLECDKNAARHFFIRLSSMSRLVQPADLTEQAEPLVPVPTILVRVQFDGAGWTTPSEVLLVSIH